MINSANLQDRRKSPKLLARSPFGRGSAVSTAGNNFGTGGALAVGLTQRHKIALAGHFKAVRIGIPNIHTASISGVLAAVGVSAAAGAWASSAPTVNNTGQATAAIPVPSETVSSAGVWRGLTFDGAASGTLAAAPNASNLTTSWTWSDWAPIKSVSRTDGGVLPILDLSIFVPTAAGSITLAWTGASNNAWAMLGREDISLGKFWRVWNQDVDGVTTPANFTQTTTTPQIIPVIVQYLSDVGGVTVFALGDSNFEASAGATYPWLSFGFQASSALSSLQFPVEFCSLGCPGATTLQLLNKSRKLFPELREGVLLAQIASINNFGTTLGARTFQEGVGHYGSVEAAIKDTELVPVYTTMHPVTTAARAWGTTDSQRVALNSWLLSEVSKQRSVFDMGQTLDGVLSGGQIQPKETIISTDGIHFNDLGQATLAGALREILSKLL